VRRVVTTLCTAQPLAVIQPVLPRNDPAPILESPARPDAGIWHWADEADCAACAQALAQRPGIALACIELHGSLGAGKTTFVRHLLRALGVQGRIKSPTYTVMESYTVDSMPGLVISHFDFYRFSDAREWADAGLRDVFAAPGVKLVEWPEHAAGMLPVADLQLHITVPDEAPDRRVVRWHTGTALGRGLLA
jgi:tRNA threonylcarbamoyladenosine biosynthesis protein TsaE